MKRIDSCFYISTPTGEQKSVYVDIDGVIYVVRHDYITGTPSEEVDAAVAAKIEAYVPVPVTE